MTDEEYVRQLSALIQKDLDLRSDDDYVINPPQMDKFLDALSFLKELVAVSDGELNSVKLVPKEVHGWLSANMTILDLFGDNIVRFSDVVRNCSAFGVDALNDGRVCVDFTIPNVFVRKEN